MTAALLARLPGFPVALLEAARALDGGEGLVVQAWEAARLVPGLDPTDAARLALAPVLAARSGSTALPLDAASFSAALGALADRTAAERAVALASHPGVAPLVGPAGSGSLLVLDEGLLYVARLWDAERTLAGRIAERATATPLAVDPARAATAEADAAGRPTRARDRDVVLAPGQLAAVRGALGARLSVITGGPGTGKTSIVVALLRLVARLGVAAPRIALAAPTGKAAQRLGEATSEALASIARPAAEDLALSSLPEPSTLHRLLGYSPARARFTHHARRPLPHEVVVVDEASMIDLALMARLFEAVGPDARLVLLGDADQLPSVDAGAVLRDLVRAAPATEPPRPPAPAAPTSRRRARARAVPAAQLALPLGELASPQLALPLTGAVRALAVTQLTDSYRMDPSDPDGRAILLCAGHVLRGEPDALLGAAEGALRATDPAALTYHGPERVAAARRAALLDRHHARHVAPLAEAARVPLRVDPSTGTLLDVARAEELARALEHGRVLCLVREAGGGASVDAVNAVLGARLGPLAPGTPLVARGNDYGRGLWNGELGLVVLVSGGRAPEPRALFPRRVAGEFRPLLLHPETLGTCDPAFAITVHQSQGSELDEALLLLPDQDLALASRELLYTAITRCRRSIVVCGDEPVVRGTAARTQARTSGLARRLGITMA